MIELENKHQGQNAIVIMGGPSILENGYDLSLLNNCSGIIFLESKALTPRFLEYGIKPDYYMMFYPEKSRTNTLQQQFLQAISCGFELSRCLKKEYVEEWVDFKDRFDQYADIWRFSYPHKRFRIKKDVVLLNSPLSLLEKLPNMNLITYDKAYEADGFNINRLPNRVYEYTHDEKLTDSFDSYFNPKVVNGKLAIPNIGRVNSAAIALYPLLNYMGFKKVFFIGMDMSYLGALEFSSFYTFKSMHHFGRFFNNARPTFSYRFPRGTKNGIGHFIFSLIKNKYDMTKIFEDLSYDIRGLNGRFLREKNQYQDCEKLFNYNDIEFNNIFQPFKYAKPIPGINNISFNQFIKLR